MDHQVSWVADLQGPTEACKREHDGVPLVISADDISRANAELSKGLHDVVFNTILISPMDGNARFILGSIA
jgi:hypothetical protein